MLKQLHGSLSVSIHFDSWREVKLSADRKLLVHRLQLLIGNVTHERHQLVSPHCLWNGRRNKWTNRHLIVRNLNLNCILFFNFASLWLKISYKNIHRSSPRWLTIIDNRWQKVSKWALPISIHMMLWNKTINNYHFWRDLRVKDFKVWYWNSIRKAWSLADSSIHQTKINSSEINKAKLIPDLIFNSASLKLKTIHTNIINQPTPRWQKAIDKLYIIRMAGIEYMSTKASLPMAIYMML